MGRTRHEHARREPLAAQRVLPVLRALGWTGELRQERVPWSALGELVRECPGHVVFDWRESARDTAETIEASIPGLPQGWAKGAKSPEAVRSAAMRAAPDWSWKPWAGNDASDSQSFLLVRARVWREVEGSWLPEVLEWLPTEEEAEAPDRAAQTLEVARRVLTTLSETGALELATGAALEPFAEALGQRLRRTYPGDPVLGELLGDWILGRPEVEDLFVDDTELGTHIRDAWKGVIRSADGFPIEGTPGGVVTIEGAPFRDAQWVTLGDRELTIVGDGGRLLVRVPEDMEPGEHRFVVALRTGAIVRAKGLFRVRS